MSPLQTLRLLGNWLCSDRIEEGGRCAPDDADHIEDEQWELVKQELVVLKFSLFLTVSDTISRCTKVLSSLDCF